MFDLIDRFFCELEGITPRAATQSPIGLSGTSGERLRQFFAVNGLDGWKDDKEKFKLDLINDIKTFLFGKWEKPWDGSVLFDANGKVISGFYNIHGRGYYDHVNTIRLAMNAGESPFFITGAQIAKQGGTVTDAKKWVGIISFIPIAADDNKDKIKFMLPKSHTVINVDFVNGIKKPIYKTVEFEKKELNEYIEAFIAELVKRKRVPKLHYDQADRCYFSHTVDFSRESIHMVNINQFKEIDKYYSVLFHEITHSTMNPDRCGRGKNATKLAYANEELVAEMGAMILCSEMGLEYTRQNSIPYLKGWLKGVKGDPDEAMLEAYSYACDAAEYLLADIDLASLVPQSMSDRANNVVNEPEKVTEEKSSVKASVENPVRKLTAEKTNIKPWTGKPKIADKTVKVSESTAVKDVLTLDKYKTENYMAASVVYRLWKDEPVRVYKEKELTQFQLGVLEPPIKASSRFTALAESVFINNGHSWKLTEFGAEFIRAVKGRISTFKDQKYGTKLFGFGDINEQFNDELEMLILGTLPKNHVFYLGDMGEILRSIHIPALPIEMLASKLKTKANQDNHLFDLPLMVDLPKKLDQPVMIFKSKTVTGSIVVLTEILSGSDNFIVAIEIGRTKAKWNKEEIQINDVRSIYPKDTITDILNWINGGLLLWADNKKASDLLVRWRSNSAKATQKIKGSSIIFKTATNVIRNFQNTVTPGVGNIGDTPKDDVLDICKSVFGDENVFEISKGSDNNFGLAPLGSAPRAKTSRLPGDIGKFLGEYDRERYTIALKGDKGAGKSRLMFQLVNAYAGVKLKCAILSMEMSPKSSVIQNYTDTYIDLRNKAQIVLTGEDQNYESLSKICEMYDVVALDSWNKVKGVVQEDFDRLQKQHPQTIIISIFQSTTGKVTRGGNQPEYDAGTVIQVHKGGHAVCEKNRYAATDHVFNVFDKKLESEAQDA